MKDQTTWSFPVGRVCSIAVRVHMLVVLFGIACLALVWQWSDLTAGLSATMLCFAVATGWLMAIAAHEAGRLVMAWQMGCDVQGMTVMPWGSLLEVPPLSGLSRLLLFSAGPLANIAAALVGVLLCYGLFDTELPLSFYNPFRPQNVLEAATLTENIVRVSIWMNLFLALINLAPVPLFDGGQMVIGSVQRLLPNDTPRFQQAWVTLIGQVCALGLVLAAVVIGWPVADQPIGVGFFLMLAGITLFFAARLPWGTESAAPPLRLGREANASYAYAAPAHPSAPTRPARGSQLEEEGIYLDSELEAMRRDEFDLEHDAWHEEPSSQDEETLSTWLKERQSERAQQARVQEQQTEAEDERQADAILEKVHQGGLQSLTPEEKQVLDRVSARLRKRSREEA